MLACFRMKRGLIIILVIATGILSCGVLMLFPFLSDSTAPFPEKARQALFEIFDGREDEDSVIILSVQKAPNPQNLYEGNYDEIWCVVLNDPAWPWSIKVRHFLVIWTGGLWQVDELALYPPLIYFFETIGCKYKEY